MNFARASSETAVREWQLTFTREKTMNTCFLNHQGMVKIFVVVAISLLLSACGAGRTMVLAPAETSDRFTEAEIIDDQSTVQVPAEVNSSFQSKLSQLIYGEGGFAR